MKSRTIVYLAFALLTVFGQLSLGAPIAKAGNYKLDLDHSNIGFEISHLGISVLIGRFNKFTGAVAVSPNGTSQVNITIESASVDTKSKTRDDHLRKQDFFNVAQFAQITFVSNQVTNDADGNPQNLVGTLTILGQSKEVVLSVVPVGAGAGPLGDSRVGFRASTTIKRADFGMTTMLPGVGNDVKINIEAELILQ